MSRLPQNKEDLCLVDDSNVFATVYVVPSNLIALSREYHRFQTVSMYIVFLLM